MFVKINEFDCFSYLFILDYSPRPMSISMNITRGPCTQNNNTKMAKYMISLTHFIKIRFLSDWHVIWYRETLAWYSHITSITILLEWRRWQRWWLKSGNGRSCESEWIQFNSLRIGNYELKYRTYTFELIKLKGIKGMKERASGKFNCL